MLTVYKYNLPKFGYNKLELPLGSLILCAKEQNGEINIWVELNNDIQITKDVHLLIVGTGWEIEEYVPDGLNGAMLNHIGTVFVKDLVWHVYEIE